MDLEKCKTSTLRAKLLEVKGVDPETADEILLYGFKHPFSKFSKLSIHF
ncbi:MAG: hypothetical protein K9W44_13465 [Candidatus Lokiarchaeota archaeon]|nr:hypothetical protein [Candidatus Harpocratesius repetitus]